jgi:group II intron reverse transcriptase/maturase
MNEHRKSDSSIVPEKLSNKDSSESAEAMEGRGLTKGNQLEQNTPRTQGRRGVSSALERVREAVQRDKEERFTALFHHVYDVERLRDAYDGLKRQAVPGVDGETWRHYGQDLEENLKDLSERLKRGAYRAKPVQRAYIPKADGKERPIGIPTLEDKIVQRATVEVLNSIYEKDFLGFSYGFRPGKSQHSALDALSVGIMRKKVSWVLETDIRSFFDTLKHEWLVKFVEHRIGDRRIVRLIQKWLNAGVLEEGKRIRKEEGTVQGGSISPLLSNIYLHYVFDVWVHWWRRHRANGEVIVVRYADDWAAGFQYQSDAQKFLRELKERFARFGLELHTEKTRLIEFGRFAAQSRLARGEGKPETFDFLGFTHICGKKKSGKFTVLRKTVRKRWQNKLKEVRQELRVRMHRSVPEQGAYLKSVLLGHMRYYGVPMNGRSMNAFRYALQRVWWKVLRRRSQKHNLTWKRLERLIAAWFPPVRIYHPYPLERLRV